jgi:muramidase (phage lysozyme)
MTSSVNVGGSATSAKNNILLGGTLGFFGLKSGVGSTLGKAYSTKSVSGVDNRLGLRPMAGITNIDIKSKSAYGSLREAVVNFQCWDIHQLEELELLYMRPGYTVLVEWGWSPYLNDSGNLVTTPPKFYDILNKGTTNRTTIFKELYDKSTASGGNYDAMFGYVKNYQWSARPDGGYDCQTTIISTGEIIESLKVNYVLPDLTRLNNTTKNGDGFLNAEFTLQGNQKAPNDFKEHYEKNILAGVWAETYFKLKEAQSYVISGTSSTPTATLSANSIFKDKFIVINAPYLKSNWSPLTGGTEFQAYITLEAAFDIINKYVIPKDGKDNLLMELSTKTEGYTGPEEDLLCVAHPVQVSVDPTVCVIKSPIWYETGSTGVLTGISTAASTNPLQVKADAIKKAATDYVALFDATKVAANQARYKVFETEIKKIADITEYQQINNLLGATNIKTYLENLRSSGGVLGLQNSIYTATFDHLEKIIKLQITKNVTFGSGTLDSATVNLPAGTTPPPTSTVSVSSLDNAKAALTELKKLPKEFFTDLMGYEELGTIGNIFVNLNFLYQLSLDSNLESSDTKEKNEINLYKYVKNIMSAIQPAIGNVNSFEVHVDPVDNKARVIDINFTKAKNLKLFELQVGNLNSVVRNYSLQSQIFPEQSSIIAIGSQAKGGQLGMQNNTMIDFNTNLIDRIIPEKDFGIKSNYNVTSNTTTLASNLGGIIFMFSTLSQTATAPGAGVDIGTLFTRCKSNLRDLIVYFQSITKSPGANRNIIPFKFSFEMDGIGGLVIGHLFTVNQDILPKGYKGGATGVKLAQTVTGISHTLSNNNDWTTKIDALNIVLGDGPNTIKFSSLNLSTLIEESFKNSLQSQLPPTTTFGGSGISPINFGKNNVPTNAQGIASFGQVSTAVPLGFRPLLDTIAYAEGLAGAGTYNGYDTLVTFVKIPAWSPTTTLGHPNQSIFVSAAIGTSDAGGRYQFLYTSWLGVNNNVNVAFTPENQDKAAAKNIQDQGFTYKDGTDAYTVAKQQIANNAIDVSKNPAFLKFLDKNYKQWASLPSSSGLAGYANQGGKYSPASIYAVYIEAVKKY